MTGVTGAFRATSTRFHVGMFTTAVCAGWEMAAIALGGSAIQTNTIATELRSTCTTDIVGEESIRSFASGDGLGRAYPGICIAKLIGRANFWLGRTRPSTRARLVV